MKNKEEIRTLGGNILPLLALLISVIAEVIWDFYENMYVSWWQMDYYRKI
ncbi:hypothetical protein [Lederbergia citrea]|nr:hypothetical protein [Lederbergia citrea]MBS4177669.1 hypothetical protein [Lederbergia citrea]